MKKKFGFLKLISTRNICGTCMPPKLKCHCDLDLWSRNPIFNRGHLLFMTNHHTKLEDPWAINSVDIDRTRFVYGPTNIYNTIYSLFSEGEHNKYMAISQRSGYLTSFLRQLTSNYQFFHKWPTSNPTWFLNQWWKTYYQ